MKVAYKDAKGCKLFNASITLQLATSLQLLLQLPSVKQNAQTENSVYKGLRNEDAKMQGSRYLEKTIVLIAEAYAHYN